MGKDVCVSQAISDEVSSIVKVNGDVAFILIKCGDVSIMRDQRSWMIQFIPFGTAQNSAYLQF